MNIVLFWNGVGEVDLGWGEEAAGLLPIHGGAFFSIEKSAL
jgi:hypothetical protein